MFEPEVFRKQMYCIEECTYDNVGTFRRPPQSFGAPIMIGRRGICALLDPLVTLLPEQLNTFIIVICKDFAYKQV